jgi:hypothetical protein
MAHYCADKLYDDGIIMMCHTFLVTKLTCWPGMHGGWVLLMRFTTAVLSEVTTYNNHVAVWCLRGVLISGSVRQTTRMQHAAAAEIDCVVSRQLHACMCCVHPAGVMLWPSFAASPQYSI